MESTSSKTTPIKQFTPIEPITVSEFKRPSDFKGPYRGRRYKPREIELQEKDERKPINPDDLMSMGIIRGIGRIWSQYFKGDQ